MLVGLLAIPLSGMALQMMQPSAQLEALTREFFQGLVNHAAMTVHIDNLRGANAHHQCETVFKAFGRALRMAAEGTYTTSGFTYGMAFPFRRACVRNRSGFRHWQAWLPLRERRFRSIRRRRR